MYLKIFLKKPKILYLLGLFLISLGIYLLAQRWTFPHGLEGKYYTNLNWQGNPKFIALDPEISTELLKERRKNFSENRFSVEWNGFVVIEKPGKYTFATASDDGSWLYINKHLVVDNGGSHGLVEVRGQMDLETGVYPIQVRYFQGGGYYRMDLSWARGTQPLENLPSHILFPQAITYRDYQWSQRLGQLKILLSWIWLGTLFYFIGINLYPKIKILKSSRRIRPDSFSYEIGWIGLVLVIWILLFFYDIVFQGKTLMTTNSVPGTMNVGAYNYKGHQPPAIHVIDPAASAQIHEPSTQLTSLLYKRNIIPLWNPHAATGIPLNADMISAVFFPLSFLLYWDPRAWMWDLFMLLRIFIAGFLSYIFFRKSLELSPLSSLAGAIGYMFCGHLIWQINIVFIHAAMLLPGLLYFTEKLACRRNWWNLCFTGLTIGLLILGGHPEPSFFALFYASVYYLVRWWENGPVGNWVGGDLGGGKNRRNSALLFSGSFLLSILYWLAAVAFGLALSAIMVLPFLELVKLSPLGPHDPGFKAGTIYLPLQDMILWVIPYFWGPVNDSIREIDWQMQPGYVGIIGLLLVVMAILEKTAFTKRRVFFTGMVLFFTLKGYGIPPIFSHLVGSLPFFKVSFFTRYFAPEFLFSVATLAGFQIYRIEQGKGSMKLLAGLAFLAAVGLGFMTFLMGDFQLTFFNFPLKAFWQVIPPAMICFLLGIASWLNFKGILSPRTLAGLLCLGLGIELFWWTPRTHYDRYDPFVEAPYIRFLKNDPGVFRVYGLDGYLYPNTASAYELNDIGYVNGLVIHRFQEFSERLIDKNLSRWFFTGYSPYGGTRNLGSRIWDLLNLTYVITAPDGEDPKYHLDSFSNAYTFGLTSYGELIPGRSLGQTFRAQEDYLTGIRIFFSRFPRSFQGEAVFKLKEAPGDSTDLYRIPLNMTQIRGVYHWITFPPIANSKGRSFYFEVSGLTGSSGQVPTLWVNERDIYPDGQAYIDGKPIAGDLGFAVYSLSSHASFTKIYEGEVKIYKNNNAFPRAFVVHQAEIIPDKEKILARLAEDSFDLRSTIILEENLPTPILEELESIRPLNSTLQTAEPVNILQYESTRIRIKTRLEQPGFLVLADAYYPGWRTYVNGQERKIYLTDYFLRSVFLEKGDHEVEFRYLPASYKVGAWMTLTGLGMVITTVVVGFAGQSSTSPYRVRVR
jgi:fibro-slime domain-containing protein